MKGLRSGVADALYGRLSLAPLAWHERHHSGELHDRVSQASQALQKAISADDAFLLAHGRLAEALVELDFIDQAKDELLRVNSADRAALAAPDALQLDAITATARPAAQVCL